MDTESQSPADPGLSFAGLTGFLGRPPADAAVDFGPGKRLGDLTIVRLIGEGGMGRVYEGLQGRPSRTVAVKVMRSGTLSPVAARRFEHEAQILGRLTHPGIARIYSVGTEPVPGGVVPYFVMEYVEDALPITAYATRHDLSTSDRLALFREACRAVAHGHHKGIVHRDLKPGNILVDAAGHPKIIDFGVARSTDGDVALATLHTDVGHLVGTLQYMAPEQFAGTSDDLDIRADVYALGVVLYELLAGRPPYDVTRRPLHEVARLVAEVDPAPLSTTNARFRGDLTTIVATCLDKDRGRRYSSAAEVEADLGRYLRGEAIAASPPRLVDSLVRLARRHRAAALAVAGVVAALVTGLVGVSIFAVQAERERAAAVRERQRADVASREATDQLYLANLRTLRAGIDHGNMRLARQVYARNLDLLGGEPPLEMQLLGAGLDDALVVIDLQRPIHDLAYAPDGGALAAAVFAPQRPWQGAADTRDAAVEQAFHGLPNATRATATAELLFFSAGRRDHYGRRQACDDPWVARWRAGARGSGPRVDASGVTLATSPDGRRRALHREDGRIHVADRSAAGADVILADHRGRVVRASFNADGTRVAALDPTGGLRLWDAGSGGVIAHCGGATGRIGWFEFSPDGSRLAMVATLPDREREIQVHDAGDGRRLAAVMPPASGTKIAIPVFALSPDGGRLVTTTPTHDLEAWSTATGESLGVLRGHTTEINAVAFSPDGRQLASGATSGHVRLWDADRLVLQRELTGHDATISAFAFHPDGETLASASEDGTIRVWSRSLGEPLAVLPGHRGMSAVAFSPDGRLLAVAPRDAGVVELWNPRTVERVHRLAAPAAVAQLAWSPDGSLVAAACGEKGEAGEVRVWDTVAGAEVSTLCGRVRSTVSVSFSPDGSRLLVTWGDAAVTVWHPRTDARSVANVSDRDGTSLFQAGAVFGLDGSRIAFATSELFDAATGTVAVKMQSQGLVTRLAASPDGRTLATGMATGAVYLTDFATGERLRRLAGHTGSVRAISFAADGSRLATGSLDGTARLWDLRDGREIRSFVGHEGGVETVVFSPDGRRLVTGATDGTTRVWDVASGHELCALPGQPAFPRAVALNPEGTCIVTAAADGPIRIWGLSNASVFRARLAVSESP